MNVTLNALAWVLLLAAALLLSGGIWAWLEGGYGRLPTALGALASVSSLAALVCSTVLRAKLGLR